MCFDNLFWLTKKEKQWSITFHNMYSYQLQIHFVFSGQKIFDQIIRLNILYLMLCWMQILRKLTWNFKIVPQIREQMSGPDLYVFTLKFLVLKKTGFSPMRNTFQIYLYSMQLFSADPKIFSKKFQINFLAIKTLKKMGLKSCS